MNQRLSWRLALRNLKTQRHLNLPFVLSTAFIFSLDYVMISMLNNKFIQTRHPDLPMFMRFGALLTTILAYIFVLYANSFYQKQRHQEMALYAVLGLEKRQIRSILAKEKVVQFLSASLLSVIGGFLLGKFLFIWINRIMKDSGASLMDYSFHWSTARITVLLLLGVMVLAHLVNGWKVQRMNLVETLSSNQASQGEPKASWLLAIIGVAALAAGYYLAWKARDIYSAIQLIMQAVLLVMIGTYCLFNAILVFVFKGLKRWKRYYYQPSHFLSVSGMLSRIKANGTSLASICILSTGVLLTWGLTLSLYNSIETQIDQSMASDYQLEAKLDLSPDQVDLDGAQKAVEETGQVKDLARTHSFKTAVGLAEGYRLLPTTYENIDKYSNDDVAYMQVMNLSDFNRLYGTHLTLAENEVLMTATTDKMRDHDHLEIFGRNYRVQPISEDYLKSEISVDFYMIVLPDQVSLKDAAAYYVILDENRNFVPLLIKDRLSFNASGDSDQLEEKLEQIAQDHGLELKSRKDVAKMIYSINGGFLFVGFVVGIVLIIGVGLMLYYKQISEGLEDRRNYQIMKKVGLSSAMIRNTIRNQILTLFGLPLVVAVIHILAARPILQTLLRILGVRDVHMVISSFFLVTILFVAGYGIFYLLTSRVYYQLVNQEDHRR